jgi:hypothetical protein
MKKYHIVYRIHDNIMSTGANYEAINEIEALIQWRNNYPNAIFLYVASSDLFDYRNVYCLYK